ncbi:PREDICTED: tetraspanin-8 [Elephantulus edwardii]|uniref:tetraspanin-8 n=1 Tax=Elephantulus edwardii TaxID=28737 RepID=UPI0003F08E27|nr:PREDICTED: tetraspanin-8 [Elephantulus edwardii]
MEDGVCGILFLGIAIWVRVNQDSNEILSHGDFHIQSHGPANLLIAVGAIIMVLGFLGCCGAIKESRCLLIVFFAGLFLILILQLAAGGLGVASKPKFESIMNVTLHEAVKLMNGTNDNALKVQRAVDKLQKEFKCCGLIDGAADWGNNLKKYLDSCKCKDTPATPCKEFDGESVYTKTCASYLRELIEKYLTIIIGVAFGLIIIEVIKRKLGKLGNLPRVTQLTLKLNWISDFGSSLPSPGC